VSLNDVLECASRETKQRPIELICCALRPIIRQEPRAAPTVLQQADALPCADAHIRAWPSQPATAMDLGAPGGRVALRSDGQQLVLGAHREQHTKRMDVERLVLCLKGSTDVGLY
jgi:hypothetical protein